MSKYKMKASSASSLVRGAPRFYHSRQKRENPHALEPFREAEEEAYPAGVSAVSLKQNYALFLAPSRVERARSSEAREA